MAHIVEKVHEIWALEQLDGTYRIRVRKGNQDTFFYLSGVKDVTTPGGASLQFKTLHEGASMQIDISALVPFGL